jgi:hypothetical protein
MCRGDEAQPLLAGVEASKTLTDNHLSTESSVPLLLRLGLESAHVRVQGLTQTCVRCSEYQVRIQINYLSALSIAHPIFGFLWVATARWTAPTGLAGARTSRCKCPCHLTSAPPSAFWPAYPLTSIHDSRPSQPTKLAFCLAQPMYGNSYNTSVEEACRKVLWTHPQLRGKLRHVWIGGLSGE